jgi:hypothetical protein
MKVILTPLLVLLLTACVEKPLREGYAVTYYDRDPATPGITYEASTRLGIPLSDLHDPKRMRSYLDSMSNPAKPFYIRVFEDHILVTEPNSNTTYTVDSKNLIRIEWKK